VPDLSGSRRQTDSWTVHGSPEEVLALVVKGGQDRGGRVANQGDGEVEFRIGSRRRLRTLGFLASSRTMPLLVRVTVTDQSADKTLVSVEAESDEGWYAFEVASVARRKWTEAFAELFASVRRSAPPTND
jgi:hypothetical protein